MVIVKGEIYDGLKFDGVVIVNSDSDFVDYWFEKLIDCNVKCFFI